MNQWLLATAGAWMDWCCILDVATIWCEKVCHCTLSHARWNGILPTSIVHTIYSRLSAGLHFCSSPFYWRTWTSSLGGHGIKFSACIGVQLQGHTRWQSACHSVFLEFVYCHAVLHVSGKSPMVTQEKRWTWHWNVHFAWSFAARLNVCGIAWNEGGWACFHQYVITAYLRTCIAP